MSKPSYVSVEFYRNDKRVREDTVTIEGWLTTDFLETNNVLISPSLDYDETLVKIAIAWDKIISIIPTENIRAYRDVPVPATWEEAVNARLRSETAVALKQREMGTLERE